MKGKGKKKVWVGWSAIPFEQRIAMMEKGLFAGVHPKKNYILDDGAKKFKITVEEL